ncbi:hypothetical protein MHN79_07660, partial [Vibrio sp. Of14-4]|uniref:hypothetical protein n=1 Tax=Vibrio sp. Of14-4 TaxID=2724878 RepID=UPI001EF221FC
GSNHDQGPRHNVNTQSASTFFDPVSARQGQKGLQKAQTPEAVEGSQLAGPADVTDFEVSSRKSDFPVSVNSGITGEIDTTKAELKIDNHVGRFLPINARTAASKARENQQVSILKEVNGTRTLSYSNHENKVILSVGSWSNSPNSLRQPNIHSVNIQNLARQKMQGKESEGASGLHIVGGFAFHVADKRKFYRLHE